MSFNRKTSVWNFRSAADAFRACDSVWLLNECYAQACLEYKNVSASTKRKWRRVRDEVEAALTAKELQPSIVLTGGSLLLGPDGQPAR